MMFTYRQDFCVDVHLTGGRSRRGERERWQRGEAPLGRLGGVHVGQEGGIGDSDRVGCGLFEKEKKNKKDGKKSEDKT
jgi:hypothetical protein